MWCDPDPNAPPMETSGSTETEMILGGRFLVDHTTGEFNGQKFEGMGISGYDNIKQKYISVWLDTMGTGMMTAEGQADAKGKVLDLQLPILLPHGRRAQDLQDRRDHDRRQHLEDGDVRHRPRRTKKRRRSRSSTPARSRAGGSFIGCAAPIHRVARFVDDRTPCGITASCVAKIEVSVKGCPR